MAKLQPLFLPWVKGQHVAVTIDNVFSESECSDLIQRTEKVGYQEALVNVGGGRQVQMKDVRNSDRCILDDPMLAEKIWQRVRCSIESVDDETKQKLQLHKVVDSRTDVTYESKKVYAVGLNERLRFLRYDPGQYFKPHFDGSFRRREGERYGEESFVTLQLYLNEGFSGGETTFLSDDEKESCPVSPKAGSVLLFDHNLLHEGSTLNAGRKYVVRTDVMYTKRGAGHEYSKTPITAGPM